MIIFEKWIEENGWNFSIQGRKMYMLPKCLDKWKAIKYIAEKENINFIIAAGDSNLDRTMIEYADKSIIPRHATELNFFLKLIDNNEKKIFFTKKTGIFSAEDILDFCNKNIIG